MRDFYKYFGIPEDQDEQSGMGSGIIISEDGYILTNNHVVKDAERDNIKILTYDRKSYNAKFIGGDKSTDLAVLKVDGNNLPVAYLGNSDEVQVGQLVFAVGNPLGKLLSSTVTHGIVSAIGRNIGIMADESDPSSKYNIEEFIQTDATINPGNSGGPLVDVSGAVIGINTAIVTGTNQGYGFAIPISLAKKVADDIIKFGKVKRGFLGISMENRVIDKTAAKALGLPKAYGVIVNALVPGGAAEEAGIKEQDVILEVDGKEIFSSNQLQDIIARKHPGDNVNLKVFRDGSAFVKTIKLKSRDDEEPAKDQKVISENNDSENSTTKSSVNFDNIGLTVRNLTPADKKNLNIKGGVVVEKIKNYGIAADRGFRVGDVILDVQKDGNKVSVNSISTLEKVLKESKPGDALLFRVKTAGGILFNTLEIPK
jgi:serine protease Do